MRDRRRRSESGENIFAQISIQAWEKHAEVLVSPNHLEVVFHFLSLRRSPNHLEVVFHFLSLRRSIHLRKNKAFDVNLNEFG
jgi:hypothetical protein